MPDHLPHRAFTQLPPPPAGSSTAVRRGRALRRRRRLAGTGAAAVSMALVAGVVIASGPGSDHASDQLIPARPDVRPATAAPTSVPGQRSHAVSPPGAGQPGAPAPAPTATAAGGSARPRSATTPQPTARPQGAYRTPPLTRSYAAPSPTDARICEASVTTDGQGTRKRIDWCITPKVTQTDAGHDLSVVVCRDRTADSTLTFGRNLEADLAIEHGGKTVWRWSAGHPSVQQTHALSTPAGGCWSWTAAWTDVDHAGRPLPVGSYDLVVVSLADQVSELPEERTTFRIS
jgi:hypothetical protein